MPLFGLTNINLRVFFKSEIKLRFDSDFEFNSMKESLFLFKLEYLRRLLVYETVQGPLLY